ncbi:MAG: DUF3047 domain-containing protein, partial [Myxococcota bacterium]
CASAVALLAMAVVAGGVSTSCSSKRAGVLVPERGASLTVMDFSRPVSLDPLPAGWYYREFLTRRPVDFSLVVKEGVPALRLATSDSASMIFRMVDVPLDSHSILHWRWYVEDGIDSDRDERTTAGDDHPARLYLVFRSASDERRRMEIIWGNERLAAGEYLHLEGWWSVFLGSFPHYVANGGRANEGRWHDETVDLREIYRELWGDPSGSRLVDIGLFADTDETGDTSVAYFADVHLERHSPPTP